MAGENTQSTFEAYKEVYGNKLALLVPNSSIIKRIVEFSQDEKLGDSYRQSVTLTNEHGFTYGGSAGGVSSLVTQVNAVVKEANSTGFALTGRARVGYTAASRAAQAGKQAVAKLWDQVLRNLKLGHEKRAELGFLRGQMGLGEVESISGQDIVITEESWSPTTWAGMEGAVIVANSNQAADGTQQDGDITVASVAFSTRTITVTGTITGLEAGNFLYMKGAIDFSNDVFMEGPGLVKIAANTGTLFGIAGATYGLWTGNTSSSFGTPSMGKVLAAITNAVDKGLEEKVVLLAPPKAWEHLNADLAASRMFDGSYTKEKAENGAQKISYYGQAGEIEVRAHPYLQRGEMVAFPMSPYKRIGSCDVSMGVPGLPDSNNIFFHDTSTDAMEARSFSDVSVFCHQPGTSLYISGVTYPS